jgi:acetoin utilization protein AcuB
MKVERWMSEVYTRLLTTDRVVDALHKLREKSSSYAIVVDDENKFHGFLHRSSIQDVDMEKPIEEYVAFPDFYIFKDSTIEEAALMFLDSKEDHLAVVNQDLQVEGIITLQEILEAFVELSAMDESGTRIVLELADKPGELKRIIDVMANNKVNILSILTVKDESSRTVSIKVSNNDVDSIAGLLEMYEIPYVSITEEEGF